jgi:UPF0755 protein
VRDRRGLPEGGPGGWDDYRGHDPELEDDVVYIAEEPGFFRRTGAVLSFFLLFVFVVLGLGGFWLYSQVNPTPSAEEVTVVIPSDSGIVTISRVLEERGVVTSGAIFRYYARLKGIGPVRPGEYDKLHRSESMDKVIERLESGPTPVKFSDLPLPEGLWLAETTARIREKFPQMTDAQVRAALGEVRSKWQPEGKPIDGFLFPATYRVTEKHYEDANALVDQMVNKFDEVADQVGLGGATAKLDGQAGKTQLTPYDVVKVASYIEAEAKVPEDRSRIARVIYNRLKAGMRLELDATVVAALGERRAPTQAETRSTDSPLNLYRNAGLTPVPINSPGADSLRAALEPSTEPNADRWLFYVLKDKDGHHAFSVTREEHDRRVAEARRAGVL